MKPTRTSRLMGTLLLFGMANSGAAQVMGYTSCTVEDPSSFVAAITTFWDAMSHVDASNRPTAMINQTLWNGGAPGTHSIAAHYADYAAWEDSRARIGANAAAWTRLGNSISAVAECPFEALFVRLGSWGTTDADWEYYAVYGLRISDIRAYMEAFAEFAESDTMNAAPGPVELWQHRAGAAQGPTHFVNFHAPSFSALNAFIDSLGQSEDYADFVDEVESIRTVGIASQYRRIMTLEP